MNHAPNWSNPGPGAFMSVEADVARGLVKVVRLERRFDDPEEFREGLAQVLETIERLRVDRRGLLLDFRHGPSSNSPLFEEQFVPFLVAASRPFDRAAGLVRTAVGKLQLQRYIRQGQLENLQAFINERLALAFVA